MRPKRSIRGSERNAIRAHGHEAAFAESDSGELLGGQPRAAQLPRAGGISHEHRSGEQGGKHECGKAARES